MKWVVYGNPIAKPRMTRRDVWKKRPCVVKYRAWADKIRAEVPKIESGKIRLKYYIAFPASYPTKKREKLKGCPHTLRPDIDNLNKGVLDALFEDDCGVHEIHAEKKWDDGDGARCEIEV